MKVKSESEVAQSCPLFETPQTAAYQDPLSMGFSRQKYWSGLPLPSPSKTVYILMKGFKKEALIPRLKKLIGKYQISLKAHKVR